MSPMMVQRDDRTEIGVVKVTRFDLVQQTNGTLSHATAQILGGVDVCGFRIEKKPFLFQI